MKPTYNGLFNANKGNELNSYSSKQPSDNKPGVKRPCSAPVKDKDKFKKNSDNKVVVNLVKQGGATNAIYTGPVIKKKGFHN